MEKKLTKNEKGITLVALIITIIVLLILAVVSIRAITGDNILGKAETAKNKYESAKSNELDILKDYGNNIEPEKIDIQEVLNKAYVMRNGENTTIYSIINDGKNTRGITIKNTEKIADAIGTIQTFSTYNEIISVFVNEKKVEINQNNFLKCTSDNGGLMYISKQYLFIQPNNGDKYNSDYGSYFSREEAYDNYLKQS